MSKTATPRPPSPEGYDQAWRRVISRMTGMVVFKIRGKDFKPGKSAITRAEVWEAVAEAFDEAAERPPGSWREPQPGEDGQTPWQTIQLAMSCAFGEAGDVVIPRKARSDFRAVMVGCIDGWFDLANEDMESPEAKAIIGND